MTWQLEATKKAVMIAATPETTFQNAIVVFGERNGSFAGFQSALNDFLKENQTSVGSVSICGYSSGGASGLCQLRARYEGSRPDRFQHSSQGLR